MRLTLFAVAALGLASPALAGPPPGPDLVIEALDRACAGFIADGDAAALAGRAEALGLIDIGPFHILRAPGADVLVTGRAASAGQPRQCRAALDSDPAIAAPLPGKVRVWATAHGFKPAGKPVTGADEKGRAFVSSKWKATGAMLEMRELAPAASNGRINIVLDWTRSP